MNPQEPFASLLETYCTVRIEKCMLEHLIYELMMSNQKELYDELNELAEEKRKKEGALWKEMLPLQNEACQSAHDDDDASDDSDGSYYEEDAYTTHFKVSFGEVEATINCPPYKIVVTKTFTTPDIEMACKKAGEVLARSLQTSRVNIDTARTLLGLWYIKRDSSLVKCVHDALIRTLQTQKPKKKVPYPDLTESINVYEIVFRDQA